MIERGFAEVAVVFGVSANVVTGATSAPVSLHESICIVLDDQEKKRGSRRLKAEVVRIRHDLFDAVVFGDTSDIRVGQTIELSRTPLTIPLGPGLLGAVTDAQLNTLTSIASSDGIHHKRGSHANSTDEKVAFLFKPRAKLNDIVRSGDVLGIVKEGLIEHKIVVPYAMNDRFLVSVLATEKMVFHDDTIACLEHVDNKTTHDITLTQWWSPRKSLPARYDRLPKTSALTTKLRAVDVLAPIAKGSAACVLAPTKINYALAHHLARNVEADVVIYVAGGERSLELMQLLDALNEPAHVIKNTLLARTLVIANSSSDLGQQELSLASGATVAEYFQRMGHNVVLIADGLSLVAESLCTINEQLAEPIDVDGLPLDFGSRLSNIFERACCARDENALDQPKGTLTIIGCVETSTLSENDPSVAIMRSLVSSVAVALPTETGTSSFSFRHSSSKFADLPAAYREAVVSGLGSRETLCAFYTTGKAIAQKIELLGEGTVTVADYVNACKAQLFDDVFLYQDPFSEFDRAPSEKRIASQLKHVLALMQFNFSFSSTRGAHDFFSRLTPMMGELNRMSTSDPRFESHLKRISELVVSHHAPAMTHATTSQA